MFRLNKLTLWWDTTPPRQSDIRRVRLEGVSAAIQPSNKQFWQSALTSLWRICNRSFCTSTTINLIIICLSPYDNFVFNVTGLHKGHRPYLGLSKHSDDIKETHSSLKATLALLDRNWQSLFPPVLSERQLTSPLKSTYISSPHKGAKELKRHKISILQMTGMF